MLNLGSGGCRLRGVVNLDVTPVTGPHVVGDGYALPFPDLLMVARKRRNLNISPVSAATWYRGLRFSSS